MAYISQEEKKQIAAALKLALKDVNIKYSLSIQNYSTIVCTIAKSDIDFIGDYNETAVKKNRRYVSNDSVIRCNDKNFDVNHYYIEESFSDKAAKVLATIKECLLTPDYFDESDSQSDYFHCSHYINIKIGSWNKPFEVIVK